MREGLPTCACRGGEGWGWEVGERGRQGGERGKEEEGGRGRVLQRPASHLLVADTIVDKLPLAQLVSPKLVLMPLPRRGSCKHHARAYVLGARHALSAVPRRAIPDLPTALDRLGHSRGVGASPEARFVAQRTGRAYPPHALGAPN